MTNVAGGVSVRTIDRATAILEILAAQPNGVALRDVARGTGLAPATSHRLLSGLEATGLVRRGGRPPLWQPGPRLARLAEAVQPNAGHDTRTIDEMERMAAAWDAGVVVTMLTEGWCTCVATVGPSVAGAHLGARLPWHASAAGRAILAALPQDTASALLEAHPRPRFTRHTRTDATALLGELDGVRERGWAVCDGERVPALMECAVTFPGPPGEPPRALSIGGSRTRLSPALWAGLPRDLRRVAESLRAPE